MPTHDLLQAVLPIMFAKMAAIFNIRVSKRQQSFLGELFRTVFALQGRVNFTNMARFSPLHEQTFRRQFREAFDWVSFNLIVLRLRVHPAETLIGVFDASFLPKSGTKTYGIDQFFSSTARAVRSGLEVAILAVIAPVSRRTYALDATQTPPGLAQLANAAYTRIDFYLEQVTDLLARLNEVHYWVADGNYARRKVFDTLTAHGKAFITKLRPDADLKFLASAKRPLGPGRPARYAGKVCFRDFDAIESRFTQVSVVSDLPHVRIYSALVYAMHFKQSLRLVVLVNENDGSYMVLCSTDLEQAAEEIVRFYRLRFQLEFVIRDAKQFTGLTHGQVRDEAGLDFHLNMSFAAVNLGRLLSYEQGISLTSYVRQQYNRFLVRRIFTELSLEAEFDENHPRLQPVINIGRMAA